MYKKRRKKKSTLFNGNFLFNPVKQKTKQQLKKTKKLPVLLFIIIYSSLFKSKKKMSLFAQLVCTGCKKILTYSLGAISCKCAECGTVNPSQLIAFDCPECDRELVAPINTIEILCPICASTTLIPAELLPRVPTPFEETPAGAEAETKKQQQQGISMVVRNPTSNVSIASKIDP